MTREADLNDTEVFRVVLKLTYKNGVVGTEVKGPYRTEGAAKSQLTRMTNRLQDFDYYARVSSYIERSVLNWESIDLETN